VNHEANSIYNDIAKFDISKMDEATKEFKKYPKEDATLIFRGSDGQILRKKGEEKYLGQDLAYIYNDNESLGKAHDWAYTPE